ncbi:hypothetical protein J4714_13005 [Staphylococcus epidermidis]|nr:hypothetical protein [Staphylococcus epidermidis]
MATFAVSEITLSSAAVFESAVSTSGIAKRVKEAFLWAARSAAKQGMYGWP